MPYRKRYDDGGMVAQTILQQLGGMGRLKAMTGAYNFIDIGNGVSFKMKNPRANYVKIKLNSLDLYDLEVGRIRGDSYKVVSEHKNIYADQLKPLIEKASGLYLSFAKGGELGIKNKLAKSSFALPYQIAIYVPSTKDKDVKISKLELELRVDEVKKYLAQLFGGFNSVQVEGGYQSQDKGLIKEDAVRVVAFGNKENIDENIRELIKKVKYWCNKWGQESMGLEFENDMYYVDDNTQFEDGGMFADGGDIFQIKDSKDRYYSMMSGKPSWKESPDLGYQYSIEDAEKLVKSLGKDFSDLQIVKYDKDWWKKFAVGGYVDLSKEKPSIMQDSEKFVVPEVDLVRLDKRKFEGSRVIRGSEDAVEIFRQFWDKNSLTISENLNVMLLNQANKVIGVYQHSKGSVNGTVADPEMIALAAVKSLAKGVIIAHNHPSSNLMPSKSDIDIANKIKQGLKLFDIKLLDSLIITEDSFNSLADSGEIMADGGSVLSDDGITDKEIVLKAIKENKFEYSEIENGIRADADVKYSGNIHTVSLIAKGKSMNEIKIDSIEVEVDDKQVKEFFKEMRSEVMEDGGDIDEYKRWESRYDMLSELYSDADADERKVIQKAMNELEYKMHKSERGYKQGGRIKFK